MLIRVSVAEIIGDQAFSVFPGVDRVILQLDGPSMVLKVDGQDHSIATPFAFPGEARVTCRLSAPGTAHDLNLMLRRGTARGHMEVRHLNAGTSLRIGDRKGLSAFLALTPCILAGPGEVTVGPWDMIVAEASIDLVTGNDCRGVILSVED